MPERKIEYQVLEHRAEPGFFLSAPSLERLYVDAGLALTDRLARLDAIQPGERRTLSVTGETRAALMTQWINGLVTLFDKERFLSRRIVFSGFDGKRIQATLQGEKHDPIRHGQGQAIGKISEKNVEVGESPGLEGQFYAKVTFPWVEKR